MKKILLVGNPNVGKSAIFNRLTGLNAIVSNYPGTTVEYTKGTIKIKNEIYEVIDTPGAYSFLEPSNDAERIAAKQFFDASNEDIIINVVDATNLERNLYLTTQILESGKKVIVALNLWDDTIHKGIKIDVEKLQKYLNVLVVPTSGYDGYGIKDLIEKIKEVKNISIPKHSRDERWKDVGTIVQNVQTITHKHHTIIEKIQDITIKKSTGIPLAILTIFLLLELVHSSGEFLIGIIDKLFDSIYLPILEQISESLKNNEILHNIIVGQLLENEEGKLAIDFFSSFGILSSGIYIPFGAVLPYVLVFYFFLAIFEDIGYLPRISVVFDSLFHKIGSHGYGIIPSILGFGCRVPGVIATRILDSQKQKFIILTLLTIAIPCTANIALLIPLFAKTGHFEYIYLVFFILIAIYAILGIILNKIIKGDVPELLQEIPPYRKISFNNVLKKTWMRVRIFLFKTVPLIILGIAIIAVFNAFNITQYFKVFTPILYVLFGLPGAVVIVLVTSFLRKDVAVGMLIPFVKNGDLTIMQTVIASVLVIIFVPCVATMMAMLKEMNKKQFISYFVIMLLTTLIVGITLKILLIGI